VHRYIIVNPPQALFAQDQGLVWNSSNVLPGSHIATPYFLAEFIASERMSNIVESTEYVNSCPCCGVYKAIFGYCLETTKFLYVPIFSILTSTTSHGFIRPAHGGVPVAMISL